MANKDSRKVSDVEAHKHTKTQILDCAPTIIGNIRCSVQETKFPFYEESRGRTLFHYTVAFTGRFQIYNNRNKRISQMQISTRDRSGTRITHQSPCTLNLLFIDMFLPGGHY
ncbi:PREDICTED: uncharacterized protein LOC105447961 [Wasmannia auropunctata]|uniref:uncharacterized protein LOC105447961 n=1 Tax=Wasmannia auropunctata TaxID=64793 RepID=UPI0005EE3B6A|nr:PREDICTED: uncharacterized protein LOC105447961 [Wasmannia auropunctata]XP_011684603.1 PREDICTED: uncharacterized protein LOC105447961 [Wasmannia auropunctata]